jgi:hypothetical protein
MAELFKDLIPSILTTKKYCLEDEKDYVPFIVNRALSYHDDALFYANQLNQMSGLDRRLQYDFLINSIRGKKRYFTKWAKVIKTNELKAVKLYFGYSDTKALEAMKILNKEQIAEIVKLVEVVDI